METIRDLIERYAGLRLTKDWNAILLKERLDKPYSYKRKDFPRWFLDKSQCKALFGGYPQRIPDAFCYQPIGHHLVPLWDCKERLQKLLGED